MFFHVFVFGEEGPFVHACYRGGWEGNWLESGSSWAWSLRLDETWFGCYNFIVIWTALHHRCLIEWEIFCWVSQGLRRTILILVLLIQSLRRHRRSLVKTCLYCLELPNDRFYVSMSLINIRVPAGCARLSYGNIVYMGCSSWVTVQNTSYVRLLI